MLGLVDEALVRRRDVYLITQHSQETAMPPAAF